MFLELPDGIPHRREYELLIQSNEFKKLEEFAVSFLSATRKIVSKYARKWVKDPLHQWSRQWEYPYVFGRIVSIESGAANTRILDAGSGVTFFPYFIKSNYISSEIYCADSNRSFEELYKHINIQSEYKVNFSRCDLRKMPYNDNWFDVIYCISVLEHTDDYPELLGEFYRVLRPGGRLVITFDISLDGTRDISVEKGILLLKELGGRFNITQSSFCDLSTSISEPDIFTTYTAKDIDPDLLPWKFPKQMYQLSSLLRGKATGAWPPLLTVFCVSAEKH